MTARRNRSLSGRPQHLGAGGRANSLNNERSSVVVPMDVGGTVICAECGANVKALVSGKPRAHARGGLMTNTRKGFYKCPGSGNDGVYKPRPRA